MIDEFSCERGRRWRVAKEELAYSARNGFNKTEWVSQGKEVKIRSFGTGGSICRYSMPLANPSAGAELMHSTGAYTDAACGKVGSLTKSGPSEHQNCTSSRAAQAVSALKVRNGEAIYR